MTFAIDWVLKRNRTGAVSRALSLAVDRRRKKGGKKRHRAVFLPEFLPFIQNQLLKVTETQPFALPLYAPHTVSVTL